MSDRAFFAALAMGGLLAWAVLQGAVYAATAPQPPRPVSYRATIAVGVAAPESWQVVSDGQ